MPRSALGNKHTLTLILTTSYILLSLLKDEKKNVAQSDGETHPNGPD